MEDPKNGNMNELQIKISTFQSLLSDLEKYKTELAEMQGMKKRLKAINPNKFISIAADLHTKISISCLINDGIDSNIKLLETQIAEKEASLKDFLGLQD